MILSVEKVNGSWIYIIPINALTIKGELKEEYQIYRVTFISADKLSRVRKRFGIPKKVSELKKNSYCKHFFENAGSTLAIIRLNGPPKNKRKEAIDIIKEELNILSASQLGHSRRKHNSHPRIAFSEKQVTTSALCLNQAEDAAFYTMDPIDKMGDLVLNKRWLNYQNEGFFTNALKIIRKEIQVSKSWRKNIYRVLKLVGQSVVSREVAYAFLLNMIAIESLLTRQGDKYTEALPARIEAFIGWIGYWNQSGYEARIRGLYKKRCQYVHDGNDESISIEDLLFLDDILINVLSNIINHISLFNCKEAVIEFSDKVSAEHTLGIVGKESKVRPKTLSYISRHYDRNDYENI
ncbi:MAG: hypothetical protein ABW201_19680 [Candidatus Thiodiazotropha sp.]